MTTERRFDTGPFLTAAFFCEKLLQENDGVKSAIRIVDRVIMQAQGPEPPNEMPKFTFQTNLFLQFKSGAARGSMQLEIRMVKPSVDAKTVFKNTVYFEGEDDRGNDVVCFLNIGLDQAGLYWFYVSLDDITITRIPLRVIYLRQIRQVPLSPGSGPR
jgi:hypothetical protein